MSLLEQASLIVTPNGFKESKLYSVVPSDGAGDMTVVRATTATRVNENGLIEVVPRNLLTYSEAFDDGAWTKTEVTVTANSTISPDGTTNADKLIPSTSHAGHFFSQDSNITSGVAYTQSIYAKANAYSFLQIAGSTGFSTTYQNFNLSDGTLGSTNGGIATITNIGNGWYRCTYTLTSTLTGQGRFVIAIVSLSTSVRLEAFAGNGTDGISLYGAQLEQGSTATSYFPTTNRLNIPRIDYTSGQGAILVEPQRTNLLTYSEAFDNVAWGKTNISVISNNSIAPSGTLTADLCTGTSAGGQTRLINTIGFTAGTTYTSSAYFKNSNTNIVAVGIRIDGTYPRAMFNLSTQTIDTSAYSTSIISASIVDVGNDWFRCSVVFNVTSLGSTNQLLFAGGNGFTSSIGDNFLIWGAQLEAGSYPTSYIPTVASTVTRNADVISKTGISSLIGQTEGTLFVEFNVEELEPSGSYLMVSNLTDGSAANRMGFARFPSGGIHVYVIVGGASQFTFNTTQTIGNFKLALAYKANDYKVYLNGVNVYTNTSASVPISMSQFYLNSLNGNFPSKNKVAQALLFPTRLTNAELATLTTI